MHTEVPKAQENSALLDLGQGRSRDPDKGLNILEEPLPVRVRAVNRSRNHEDDQGLDFTRFQNMTECVQCKPEAEKRFSIV
jgi:hypothetical protein